MFCAVINVQNQRLQLCFKRIVINLPRHFFCVCGCQGLKWTSGDSPSNKRRGFWTKVWYLLIKIEDVTASCAYSPQRMWKMYKSKDFIILFGRLPPPKCLLSHDVSSDLKKDSLGLVASMTLWQPAAALCLHWIRILSECLSLNVSSRCKCLHKRLNIEMFTVNCFLFSIFQSFTVSFLSRRKCSCEMICC